MDVRTIPDLLRHSLETHPKPNAFLVRRAGEWTPISTEKFATDVSAAGAWLREKGVAPGDRVAIISESRYEWAVVDVAILSMGAISVPLYPTLPANQIAPLLVDAGVIGAFVSGAAQIEKVELVVAGGEMARAGGTPLRFVWSFDAAGLPASVPGAEATPAPDADDVATIIYTSGTTGVPKGVMLTHGNIVSEVLLSLNAMTVGPEDTYLSVLPLSHVFERCAGLYTMFYAGVTIAYAESLETLRRDLLVVHPTVIMAVPRLYEKVLARAVETATGAGRFTKAIFDRAYHAAVESGRLENEGRSVPPLLALQR